jgi:hypothetical protein
MAPLIVEGSEVVLTSMDRPARRGDIVARTLGEGIVVHRVIDARNADNGRWLVTKGDRCTLPDTPVRESEVLAVVDRVLLPSEIDLRQDPWPALGRVVATSSRWQGRRWQAACSTTSKVPQPLRRRLAQVMWYLHRGITGVIVQLGRRASRRL